MVNCVKQDIFDRLLLTAFVVTCAALLYIAVASPANRSTAVTDDKALAREGQLLLIKTLYDPLEKLIADGHYQSALLQLEELAKKYPGEPTGLLLRGRIQAARGALPEAVAGYSAAVRANGSFVDARSPLSRRDEIAALVASASQAANDTGSAEAHQFRQHLYYLKSRLAGGCE